MVQILMMSEQGMKITDILQSQMSVLINSDISHFTDNTLDNGLVVIRKYAIATTKIDI